jgi:hypothetical protein
MCWQKRGVLVPNALNGATHRLILYSFVQVQALLRLRQHMHSCSACVASGICGESDADPRCQEALAGQANPSGAELWYHRAVVNADASASRVFSEDDHSTRSLSRCLSSPRSCYGSVP